MRAGARKAAELLNGLSVRSHCQHVTRQPTMVQCTPTPQLPTSRHRTDHQALKVGPVPRSTSGRYQCGDDQPEQAPHDLRASWSADSAAK